MQLIIGDSKYRGTQVLRNERNLPEAEADVCVVALSQLSREVESSQDKRPFLSDLRETGQIEQDADLIMLMYREDYYDKDTEHKDITEICIAKHRNGPVGMMELRFLKEFGRFVEEG